ARKQSSFRAGPAPFPELSCQGAGPRPQPAAANSSKQQQTAANSSKQQQTAATAASISKHQQAAASISKQQETAANSGEHRNAGTAGRAPYSVPERPGS